MSSIDKIETSPLRLPLSSGGKRSLDVMQERASALRRLADEAPERRASLLDVAQRLEGLANHAAFAVFGRAARLSDSPGKASAAGAPILPSTAGATEPDNGLFGFPSRKTGTTRFDV